MHSHIFYIWQEYVSSHLLRIWLSMSWSLHGCIYSFISKLHLQFWKRATRLKKTTLKPILFHASYFKWNGNRGLFVNILFCQRHHEMPPRGHRFKLISRGAACDKAVGLMARPAVCTCASCWHVHEKGIRDVFRPTAAPPVFRGNMQDCLWSFMVCWNKM